MRGRLASTGKGVWRLLGGLVLAGVLAGLALLQQGPSLNVSTTTSLRATPLHSPIEGNTTQIVCARMVNNDLPPVSRRGRAVTSIRYLAQEHTPLKCHTVWVLNRIVDDSDRAAVVDAIKEGGHSPDSILVREFDWEREGSTSPDYLWDLAGAKNVAWDTAERVGAVWVVFLEAHSFLPRPTGNTLFHGMTSAPPFRVLVAAATSRLLTEQSRGQFESPGYEAYELPRRLRQFTSGNELPHVAVRVSLPRRFSPSPEPLSHVREFMEGVCGWVTPMVGKLNSSDPCLRVLRRVHLLYNFPAIAELGLQTTPQRRRLATDIGLRFLSLRAVHARASKRGRLDTLDPHTVRALATLGELDNVGTSFVAGESLRWVSSGADYTLESLDAVVRGDARNAAQTGPPPRPPPPLPRAKEPRVLCARILGNDLPPLQMSGQTYTNLLYALQHEPHQPDVEYVFIVNRLVDAEMEALLIQLLRRFGFTAGTVLRRAIDWQNLALEDLTRQYVADINGARNMALDEGVRRHADWVDVVDGCEFATQALWDSLYQRIGEPGASYPMLLKAMARIMRRQDPEWLNANTDYSKVRAYVSANVEEPQVVLPSNTTLRFDPTLAYGNKNKLSMVVSVCGAAFVASNADLGEHSPCVVLDGVTYRLFPFRSPVDVFGKLTRKQSRLELRTQAIPLLEAAVRCRYQRERNGECSAEDSAQDEQRSTLGAQQAVFTVKNGLEFIPESPKFVPSGGKVQFTSRGGKRAGRSRRA